MSDRDRPGTPGGDERDADDHRAKESDEAAAAAHETGPPWARIRQSSWRGWIWSVPLAALLVAGYLGFRALFGGGPTVTVTFPTAHGISGAGSTPVRYRGLQVGHVSGVELRDSMDGVVMHLAMDGSVKHALRSGTRFWIETPSLMSGDLSGLLSGPYLAMEPGDGEPARHFQGLSSPPPDEPFGPGRTYVLLASRASGLSRGASVIYHGLDAGRVLGLSLGSTPDQVRIHVQVRPPYDRFVRPDARFWRCSGLDLSTASGGVDVRIPPIGRLVSGCVAFDDFQGDAAASALGGTPPAASGTAFQLYGSEADARSPLTGRPVRFVADFPGSVGGLSPGAPVKLRGVRVGEVAAVELRVDPDRGAITTPVTLELYPQRFGLGPRGPDESPQPLYDALDALVRRGMRAELSSSSLVLGGEQASLVMTGDRGRGLDLSQRPPRIPAIGGGDLESTIASLSRAADAVGSLPIQTIGRNLRDLSQRLDRIAGSPALERSLDHLDRALANVDTLTAEARTQIGPTLADLRKAVDDLGTTASAIQGVTGSSFRDQQTVQDLVAEMTRAARSLRLLTDYLDRHPEALIEGRSRP